MHAMIPITACWFDRHSLVIPGRYCANSAGFFMLLPLRTSVGRAGYEFSLFVYLGHYKKMISINS